MKTAEDYIRQINDRIMPSPHRLSRKQREVVKYLIGEIQKEAYNQALEDAAKSAVAYETVPRVYSSCVADKQSILKLKK